MIYTLFNEPTGRNRDIARILEMTGFGKVSVQVITAASTVFLSSDEKELRVDGAGGERQGIRVATADGVVTLDWIGPMYGSSDAAASAGVLVNITPLSQATAKGLTAESQSGGGGGGGEGGSGGGGNGGNGGGRPGNGGPGLILPLLLLALLGALPLSAQFAPPPGQVIALDCPSRTTPLSWGTLRDEQNRLRHHACQDKLGNLILQPDRETTGLLNNIRVVDGNKFTTIQAAIDDLGATVGVVLVPASYTGAEATSIPANVQVIDLRKPANTDGPAFSLRGIGFHDTSPVDEAAWSRGHNRFGINMDDAGGAGAGSANEFGAVFQANVPAATSSLANYEKTAALFEFVQADPSTGGINRDGVGLDALGIIPAGNLTGRVWGGVLRAQIDSTGDGIALGAEISVDNNGTDQVTVDTATSKNALQIVSQGTQPSTAGIIFATTGPGFNQGIIVRNVVPGRDALRIPNNTPIRARNNANTAELQIVNVNASDQLILGAGTTKTVLQVGVSGDGSGFKHARFGATCTTAATAGATCTTAYSWTTAFADANYTPVCWGVTPTGTPTLQLNATQVAASITVRVTAITAVASSFANVYCVSPHD